MQASKGPTACWTKYPRSLSLLMYAHCCHCLALQRYYEGECTQTRCSKTLKTLGSSWSKAKSETKQNAWLAVSSGMTKRRDRLRPSSWTAQP